MATASRRSGTRHEAAFFDDLLDAGREDELDELARRSCLLRLIGVEAQNAGFWLAVRAARRESRPVTEISRKYLDSTFLALPGLGRYG
jgi:hypothetical protein